MLLVRAQSKEPVLLGDFDDRRSVFGTPTVLGVGGEIKVLAARTVEPSLRGLIDVIRPQPAEQRVHGARVLRVCRTLKVVGRDVERGGERAEAMYRCVVMEASGKEKAPRSCDLGADAVLPERDLRHHD